MEAINEEHEQEYKRLALDTIKNKDFNVEDEKVVEKCLILLKKWYDKPKFENIVNYYREFQSLKRQPNESIVEFFRKFQELEVQMKNVGLELPSFALAIQLMESSNLTPQEKNILLLVSTLKMKVESILK